MAAKKPSPAMDFIVSQLKKNPKVAYADVRARAESRRLTIYPIMYGRAQAMLGLVKMAPRGSGKKAKAAAARAGAAPTANGRRRRRGAAASGGDPLDALRNLVSNVRTTERTNEDLRSTLERIRQMIDGAL